MTEIRPRDRDAVLQAFERASFLALANTLYKSVGPLNWRPCYRTLLASRMAGRRSGWS